MPDANQGDTMRTNPKSTVGFRTPMPWAGMTIPWRAWVGPLLIAGRNGGGVPRVSWTRAGA